MDKILYIAASGLKQIMRSQSVNTHNLANASTPGFRADMQAFKDMQVYGSGFPSRNYSVMDKIGTDFSEGRMIHTGSDLDVAIKGKGFMAVESSDGREAYTRSTSLKVSQNGLLLNSTGRQVIGSGGPITLPPFSKVEIGEDGTISVVPLGQGPVSLAVVDRIKLVNPEESDLEKGDDGLLYLQNGGVAPADALVSVSSGYVESSNVNVIDAMVTMIELSRNFEMQSKLMKTVKENDRNSSKLLTLN